VRRKLLVLIALLGAVFVLSGCGVPSEGVNVMETDPQGPWQLLVVWPLARALVWIEGFLLGFNIPYSWGFSIVLFTVFIKLITFPLTMTQIKGMMAQREIQPRLQELQKKHGKNREKLAQEQMKLYQEAGVNPLSGCLPLLVQMPILFGLYSALIALGDMLDNASFFWIPDLGFPEFTQGLGWIMTLYQDGEIGRLVAYLVLPVLLMVSQFLMQRYMTMTPPTGDDNAQAKMMKQLTFMMTFMFGFFTLQVPAALSLYWVTSNLLQIAQQYSIMRMPQPALAGVGMGGGTTSVPALASSGSTNGTSSGDGSSANGTSSNGSSSSKDSQSAKEKTPSADAKTKGSRRKRRKNR
jgi:YidC/Oxa1 family membrane protein insertase